jgi:MraZ protein
MFHENPYIPMGAHGWAEIYGGLTKRRRVFETLSDGKKLLFTGEYEHTLDAKNRVSIPSRFRQMLTAQTVGDKLYLVLGSNKKLWLYPDKYYEELASQYPAELIPDEQVMRFEQITFGLARWLELDGTGRIILPDKMIARAELGKDVVIIGVRDHLELWNKAEWERYVENGLSEHNQMLTRARVARMLPGSNLKSHEHP